MTRWRAPLGIRWRLLLAALATLALGLGILLVAGNVLLDRTVTGVTSRLLHARAQAQLAALTVSPSGIHLRQVTNDEALDDHAWILSEGRLIERPESASGTLDAFAAALGRRGRSVQTHGPASLDLLAEPLRAPHSERVVGAVVVGVGADPFDQLERKVLIGSLAIAGLILLGGAFAVRAALAGALGPVRRMTADAEEWGAHDLDRRFDLGPPRDELTALAMTLDHLLERIAGSRRHERRFAGDVAHELRTPLSVIRGRAELALHGASPEGTADTAELQDALEVIERQAERMSVTVETLLAIARSEIDPQAGSADLVAVVREFSGVELVVTGAVPLVEADPEIIRSALSPLIDNGRRHARSRVTAEISGDHGHARVAVRDDGPGLDPALGEAAFEPGRRGPGPAAVGAGGLAGGAGDGGNGGGGAGLGLALARRMARACGGDVTIGPGPGGCFVLELPVVAADQPPAG